MKIMARLQRVNKVDISNQVWGTTNEALNLTKLFCQKVYELLLFVKVLSLKIFCGECLELASSIWLWIQKSIFIMGHICSGGKTIMGTTLRNLCGVHHELICVLRDSKWSIILKLYSLVLSIHYGILLGWFIVPTAQSKFCD